jgi:hypothetical protein
LYVSIDKMTGNWRRLSLDLAEEPLDGLRLGEWKMFKLV